MPENVRAPRAPHSVVSYAGFPAPKGKGLWCPECGLPVHEVVHVNGRVRAWHYLHRTSRFYRDKWYCDIQGVESDNGKTED